ncbi:MAG: cytochrome c oxidase subunit II [Chloroflexota bacterium]
MRHFVVVGILVVVTSILTYVGLSLIGLMPVQASAQAVPIDWLWNLEMITISFLFSLIVVPMTYSLIVFRRRRGDMTDAEHMEGNYTLEITWTIIPLMIVVIFAYLGSYSLAQTQRVAPDAMVINVTAQQFTWTFEYPEQGGFVTDQLHIPVGKQVLLRMESNDVLHSFWVPEFRVKQDVVPGRVTEYRITPSLIGAYKVRCSEMCGTSHSYMENFVVVSEQANFDQWVAEQQALAEAAQTPEGRGEQLTVKNGCRGCHTVDGTILTAPTWLGIYGRTEQLADGSSVVVDDTYIHESIVDPKAREVAGFSPSIMPPYTFTDEEIANIIAYLKTLK